MTVPNWICFSKKSFFLQVVEKDQINKSHVICYCFLSSYKFKIILAKIFAKKIQYYWYLEQWEIVSYEQFIRLGEFLRCYKFGKKLVNIHSIVFFFWLSRRWLFETVWRNAVYFTLSLIQMISKLKMRHKYRIFYIYCDALHARKRNIIKFNLAFMRLLCRLLLFSIIDFSGQSLSFLL